MLYNRCYQSYQNHFLFEGPKYIIQEQMLIVFEWLFDKVCCNFINISTINIIHSFQNNEKMNFGLKAGQAVLSLVEGGKRPIH